MALIGLRLIHPHELPQHLGRRTETMGAIEVMRAVTAALRPVDRATRLGGGDLLLTLPSVARDEAVALAGRIQGEIADLRRRHAFVPDTTSVVLVTRDRPLPLDRVRVGLDWAQQHRVPVAAFDGDDRLVAAALR